MESSIQNEILNALQKISIDDFSETKEGEKRFRECAEFLMKNCILKTKAQQYRFVELEFYKHSEKKHPDNFCHCEKPQLEFGKWYFHWAGIDITFGKKNLLNEKENVFGGILIRGIKKNKSGEYTSGPLNVLKEAMSNFGSITDENSVFKVEVLREQNPAKIFQIHRHGLPDKNFEGVEKFREARYRFITDIYETKHDFKEKGKVKRDIDFNK